MAYTLPTDQTRQERYDQSFDTHISARRGHGHPYPSTQPALDDLTTDWLPPSHPHRYVPLERAVSDLASALRNPNFPGPQNTARALAFARLERTATARRWWPDLVFKAFADLDLLFSRNRLGGNVYLRWATPEVVSALQREGYAVGPGYVKRYGPERGGRSVRERIGIYLNAEALLLHGTLMNVWKVLLHFMVHAYLIVMTGRAGDPGDEDGPSFGRCWRAIEYRFPWDLPSEPVCVPVTRRA